jgi:hypothetical protein
VKFNILLVKKFFGIFRPIIRTKKHFLSFHLNLLNKSVSYIFHQKNILPVAMEILYFLKYIYSGAFFLDAFLWYWNIVAFIWFFVISRSEFDVKFNFICFLLRDQGSGWCGASGSRSLFLCGGAWKSQGFCQWFF